MTSSLFLVSSSQPDSEIKKRRKRDIIEGVSDSERTTRENTKAMCSLVTFLKFTGEEQGMFDNNRLPTLDVEI